MNHVDICTGIGGFALASRMMGWQTISFCEIDEFCHKVLRKNFGSQIPIFTNLHRLNYGAIKSFYRHKGRSAPRIDICTAGLPCQPYSVAGQQLGIYDERHLFPAFLNFIRSTRPKPRWIVIENVRGLLSIENGKVFSEIISSLESEGYEVITFCVPASAVEAPHRRDRLWIIARLTAHPAQLFGNGGDDHGGICSRPTTVSKLGNRCGNGVTSDSNGSQEHGSNERHLRHCEQCRRILEIGREAAQQGDRQTDSDQPCRCFEVTTNTAHEKLKTKPKSKGGKMRPIVGGSSRTSSNVTNTLDFAHAKIEGFQGSDSARQTRSDGWSAKFSGWERHWLEVAGELCGMDAIVSSGLDVARLRADIERLYPEATEKDINRTIGKIITNYRIERLKSLGNSVVPTIPFEIFKAIEEFENFENF